MLLIFLSILLAWHSNAQDSTELSPKLSITGYIKNVQTLHFNKNFKEIISGNLIHHRINIKWKSFKKITAAAEFRNRIYWGEEIKMQRDVTLFLKNENEKFNLQKVWVQNPSLLLHTNTERIYLDYRTDHYNVRIGRQRINWGITGTWNPNDLFNAFNFLDIDYEERPGVDGAKVQYIFNAACNAEVAYALSNKKKGDIAAVKYNLNKWGYDIQLITGWFKQYVTAGAGWAGNIKDAGFKGEMQYFFKNRDTGSHFNVSIDADYMLKKGLYIKAGVLFNDQGLYKPISNWDSINLKLSSENLMPTKWNILLTAAKEFSPLLSTNINLLISPGTNLLIVYPSLQYNLVTNLDADIIWQSFFTEINNTFQAVNHRCLLRLKWSF